MGDYNYSLCLQSKDVAELRHAIHVLEKENIIGKNFFGIESENMDPAMGGLYINLTTDTLDHAHVKAWDEKEYDPLFHTLAVANPGMTIQLTEDNLDSYNGRYIKEYRGNFHREISSEYTSLEDLLSGKEWLPWGKTEEDSGDDKSATASDGMLSIAIAASHISDAAKKAREKANNEPSQDSYNAAWLHGYAKALEDLMEKLKDNHHPIQKD